MRWMALLVGWVDGIKAVFLRAGTRNLEPLFESSKPDNNSMISSLLYPYQWMKLCCFFDFLLRLGSGLGLVRK